MEYQRIIDDLRRRADGLRHAADLIEEMYHHGGEDEAQTVVAARWAPGSGQPAVAVKRPRRVMHAEPEPPPAPVAAPAPKKAKRPHAPIPIVEEAEPDEDLDQNTFRQVVYIIKELIGMRVASQVLPATAINYLANKNLPNDADTVAAAIAAAHEELRLEA